MDETPDQPPSDRNPLFDYVESGMRLTHEFASLGQLVCSFGQVIELRPILSVVGWSDRKEFQAALRMRHLDPYGRELSVCLLDRDEVRCWIGLLNACLCRGPDDPDDVELEQLIYTSRHGAKLVGRSLSVNGSPWVLHVGTEQSAILPIDFTTTLLEVFADFETLCERYS